MDTDLGFSGLSDTGDLCPQTPYAELGRHGSSLRTQQKQVWSPTSKWQDDNTQELRKVRHEHRRWILSMERTKWLLVLIDTTAPLLVPSPLEEQGGFKALSGFYTVTCVCQLKQHCFSQTRNALTSTVTSLRPK